MRPHVRSATVALAGLLVLVAMSSGCSSAAKSAGMVPKNLVVDKTHPYSVQIEVAGGRDTNPVTDAPQISDEAFAQAIADAIAESSLFSEIVQDGAADYRLRVEILSVEAPMMGMNMTAHMQALWELINTTTGEAVLRETIASTHTATAGDYLVGVTRSRLATEGAASDNIEQGLSKIVKLDL